MPLIPRNKFVEQAALVHAINDAWLLIGIVTALAMLLVVFVRRAQDGSEKVSSQEGR